MADFGLHLHVGITLRLELSIVLLKRWEFAVGQVLAFSAVQLGSEAIENSLNKENSTKHPMHRAKERYFDLFRALMNVFV